MPKQVLLLNSYHLGYLWNVKLLEGMHDVLNRSKTPLRIRYEFMDAKHYTTDAFEKELRDLYRQKYADTRFDVIIASDNDAFNFLRRYRDEIFPGTPVVFCGVNDFQPEWLDGFPSVTGIGEYFDLEGTINLALDLFPDARHMVVVGGVDTSSRTNHQVVVDLMPRFRNRVEFIDLFGLNTDELARRLRQVPRDSVLLYLAYYLTPDGTRLTVQESVSFIYEHADLPMFSAWSYVLEEHMVGGKMLRAEDQGRTAAQLAMRILQGESAADVPVLDSAPTHYMFDYRMLHRYHIGLDTLPPGSTVVNLPESVLARNPKLVIGVVVFILYQTVVIIGLLISYRRRKRAEARLRHEEAQLEILLELSRMDSASLTEILINALSRITEHMSARAGLLVLRITRTEELHVVTLQDGVLNHAGPQDGNPETLTDLAAVDDFLDRPGDLYAVRSGPPDPRLWKSGSAPRRDYAIMPRLLKDRAGLLLAVADTKEGLHDRDLRDMSLFCRDIMRLVRLRLDEAVRSELEEQLLHSQKMEAIGTFAGSIAHDFNNILESIASCCELALDEIPSHLAAPRSDVRQALRSSQRGKALIRRLLDFSRREPSRMRPVSLSQLAEESLDMIRPLLPGGIEVRINIAADTPPVLGDPDKLTLVLINLLTNAIRAMSDRGLLRLEVRTGTCEGPEDQDTVLLEVRDSGCGMPPEVVSRIFDPFFTTRPKGEGTGLGLSVVDGIVRQHGGTISVFSAPGRGTRFTILLPAASRAKMEKRSPDSDPLPRGGDEHLLLVDDDPDVARALGRKLERLGYAVTLAGSGPEALDLYEDGGLFSLVLTDYDMPGMDGHELALNLQQVTPDLPVILVTGLGGRDLPRAEPSLHGAGIRAVIHKPVNHHRLARTIRALLDNTLPDPDRIQLA